MRLRHLAALALLATPLVAAAAAGWRLTPETSISVEVSWHGASVEVAFPTVSGTVRFDPADPEATRAKISVATDTATTGFGPFDAVLRSGAYLDSARHPDITFELDRLTRTSPSTGIAGGHITLRGVTRPIRFDVRVLRYGPAADDPSAFEAGFALAGSINRSDFGATGGLPGLGDVLPVRIRLMLRSD